MAVVQKLLQELELGHLPCLQVFNKIDRVAMTEDKWAVVAAEGVAVSALDTATLAPFLVEAQRLMRKAIDSRS
jgi:GTPase